MDDWKTIDSAPRNGTQVLIWWDLPSFSGVVARWPLAGRGWEITWNSERLPFDRPTHWRELPAPPSP